MTSLESIRHCISIPRSIPKIKTRVIVHNHIRHTADMPAGANGFRCWTQLKSNAITNCECGWAGLRHYRVKGTGDGKCIKGTWQDLDARLHHLR